MMMTTATTTTAHSGSPWVQTPTAWLLFVTRLCRRLLSQKNANKKNSCLLTQRCGNPARSQKRTPPRHRQEFARIDLCFSISTWLKSYFTDILRDVKNSPFLGIFWRCVFPPSPGGFSFALVLSV